MAKLSDVQIAALIVHVWGKPWTSTISDGVSIVLAESGGNPAATNRANTNGTSDHGLWQINTVHANKFRMIPAGHQPGNLWDNRYDPIASTKMAYQIYTGWGRSWRPWSAYNNGSYRKFKDRGLKAAIAVQGTDKESAVKTIIDQLAKGITGGLGIPDIADQYANLQNVLKFIGDKQNWIRLGFIIAGATLILLALWFMIKGSGAYKGLEKAVSNVNPIAKVAVAKKQSIVAKNTARANAAKAAKASIAAE